MGKHVSDKEGNGYTEHPTDRIYREAPELLGFGNKEKDDGYHPSRSSGGSSGGGGNSSGSCLGCLGLFVVFLIIGIAVLSMDSDAAFTVYVFIGLIALMIYMRTK